MWYVAHLLFAQAPQKGRQRVFCETCEVLLNAPTALKCYSRALAWAKQHEKEGSLRLVGVRHIKSLWGDEPPGDGAEIGGRFYQGYNVWQRVASLIPRKSEIPAIIWETHRKTPIGKMMSPKQKQILFQAFSPSSSKG